MKLTPTDKALLDRFAKDHGVNWRNTLSAYWLTGSVKLDEYHDLYALRNTHGPDTVLSHWTPTDQRWEDKLDRAKRL